jgi:molybdopterin molybdotransferase
MLSVQQAQEAILDTLRLATEIETVTLAQAHHRFVAAELRAQVDNPAFDNSAMDGYAVRIADLAAHGHAVPVVGEATCGSAPASLAPGSAMRIFTGAPMPAGADAVAMQEDVRIDGGRAHFPSMLAVGENVRRRGEDFRADETLYRPGTRLGAYDLALLASAGVAQVPVFRRARALVIATGDELVAPGQPLRPGQIYESNRLTTLLQLQDLGVEAIDGGTVPDDPAELRARLRDAHAYDFIITSGGASVGDRDLVKQIFGEVGQINLWKVKMKPGKPLAFGHLGARGHFFALPGNPVSSLATFKLFVEPALIAWHHGTPVRLTLTAQAANDFRRRAGRMEFLRARLYSENGQLKVQALRGQGSHMLKPLRETNAFIRLPEDSTGFEQGESVNVLPLRLDR